MPPLVKAGRNTNRRQSRLLVLRDLSIGARLNPPLVEDPMTFHGGVIFLQIRSEVPPLVIAHRPGQDLQA